MIRRYIGNSKLSEEEKLHEFSMARRLTRLAPCRIRQELSEDMCYPASYISLPSFKGIPT